MRVVIVPGLAVQGYAKPAAAELRARGYRVTLLPAPAWREAAADLEQFGLDLAAEIQSAGEQIALLIGLSVGTQAAAVAAARSAKVERLLLISPTVDPRTRTRRQLIGAWLFGDQDDEGPSVLSQLPDWAHAGPLRILTGFNSAIRLPLENVLPEVTAELTVVHAGNDSLSTHDFASSLAADNNGRFLVMPDAPHSWPVDDVAAFADLVDELTASTVASTAASTAASAAKRDDDRVNG